MRARINASNNKDVTKANMNEAIERDWEIPDFTIKEIRDAIPAHCFHRNTFKSFAHVFHDFAIISLLVYLASYIDTISNVSIRYILWPLYWYCQSLVGTGVWIIGHECGHQAFSPHKIINNSVGFVLHTILLVPFYSWKYSHSKHHKGTGNMSRDQAFVPKTRSDLGLPPRDQDAEADGPHSLLDEAPIFTLLRMIVAITLGFPLYLLTNLAGQKYSGWANHFNPYCQIFEKNQFWGVVSSTLGIAGMLSLLVFGEYKFGALAVAKYYLIPYILIHSWIVIITFLQHTDPDIPHYRDNVWNFQRGAALTVDRSYGPIIDHFHHHISDTHVAHHFFSTMPFYHAKEATMHIKNVLGKHYLCDDTPIPTALWRNWNKCRFVEDEGDVVFYKD